MSMNQPKTRYRFTHITEPNNDVWDRIEGSADSSVFTSREWQRYLTSQKQKTIVVQVSDAEDTIIGYFVGNRMFRFIVGAPLSGLGSYLGGLCSLTKISPEERVRIYRGLACWFFKKCNCLYFTVSDWQFRTEYEEFYPYEQYRFPYFVPISRGLSSYQLRATLTVDTSLSEDDLWHNSSYSSFRYSVNKAKKKGLHVRFITNQQEIASFVKILNEQIVDVANRHETAPHHYQSVGVLKALCESLYPNRLLMAQVIGTVDNTEIVMASSVFCIDKNVSSFLAAASYHQYMSYCPNEIMVWEALCELHRRGVHYTILTGTDQYKRKFGSYYCYLPKIVFRKYNFRFFSARRAYFSLRKSVYRIKHLFAHNIKEQ